MLPIQETPLLDRSATVKHGLPTFADDPSQFQAVPELQARLLELASGEPANSVLQAERVKPPLMTDPRTLPVPTELHFIDYMSHIFALDSAQCANADDAKSLCA